MWSSCFAVQLKDVLKQAQSTEKTAKTQLKDIQQKMKVYSTTTPSLPHTLTPSLPSQDSKSHHERELRAAEEGVSRSKREAEEVGTEARGREMEMQALQLEVGELEKAVEGQQQQVRGGGRGDGGMFISSLPSPAVGSCCCQHSRQDTGNGGTH